MSVRTRNWVSKTNLLRYLRCSYAFYLVDRGLIPFEASVNEQESRLIEEGVKFQNDIESATVPRHIEPADLPRVLAEESIRLFNVPVFENCSLEIFGKPDAIDTANGVLFPVEIKSHNHVQLSDEIELAFYWMLLEPYRTKTDSPRGYLLLRRNEAFDQVAVEIRPHQFERVRRLLEEIRDARSKGVRPRICGCTVCRGVMREQIERTTRANKDLTVIFGIGRIYARHLEDIGIGTYEDLITADSVTIVEKLRERRCYVSLAIVDRWKHHVTSYSTSRPVEFGNPLQLDGSFLALDLEYGPDALIWLIGVCIVGPDRRDYLALWADTSTEEKSNLMCMAQLAAANPSYPVVTWAGNGADMPQLRNAVRRHGLGQTLDTLESRHLDLYQYVVKAVRFPIPRLALADVATYFGIAKTSAIRDGLQAQSQYMEYRRCQDRDKSLALKTNLLEYNRDDIEALVRVAERLAGFRRAEAGDGVVA